MSDTSNADAIIAKELSIAVLVSLAHRIGPDFVHYTRSQMRARSKQVSADKAAVISAFVESDAWNGFIRQASGK